LNNFEKCTEDTIMRKAIIAIVTAGGTNVGNAGRGLAGEVGNGSLTAAN
jgi:hypothetical protein